MRLRIGTQTVGLHQLLAAEGIENVVPAVADIGFDGFEFAWNERYAPNPEAYFERFYGLTATDLQKLFSDHGVEPVSSHVPFAALRGDFETVSEFHQAVGCSTLGVANLQAEQFATRATVEDAAAAVSAVAERAAADGFDFVYHNHDFEFGRLNGKRAYDSFVDGLGDEVGVQFDVRHAMRADVDPVTALRDINHRVASIHVSDMTEDEKYVRLGDGALDIRGVVEFAVERAVPWIILEETAHIRGDVDTGALETLERDYEYLAALVEEVADDE